MPLVLPAHMWQIGVPIYFDLYDYVDSSLSYNAIGLLGPLAPPFPRHSITDRFEFVAIPFPYVRMALLQTTEVSDETLRLKGPAVALEGGIQNVQYSQKLGFVAEYSVKAETKFALGNTFWLEGAVSVYAENLKFLSCSVLPGVGFQLTDKCALTFGYTPNVEIYPDLLYRHSVDCYVHVNPNPYFGFSTGLFVFNSRAYWHFQPGLSFWFQW